ncbi:MAG TPA: ATP-binding protein [Ktedonobacterales bacterium]
MAETDQIAPSQDSPTAILLSGPSCVGKTTLARRLAGDLRLPLLSKDGFKETLFETLGWSDRAWSRTLGAASIEILYHAIEAQLAAGRSFIAESIFRPQWDNERWQALCARYGCSVIQIQCWAEGEVLWQRWLARIDSGARHPGHVERENVEEFRPGLLRGRVDPLEIACELIALDTTDFARVEAEYADLLARLRARLA